MKCSRENKLKENGKKIFSIYLVLTLVFQIAFPTVSMALTSGPTQPEVQSFTPVGTSEMVDPFSGDFSYNIPLLDIDGYPVNISYHSGITMDQEASWVGLGWNINPGVINRNMRGMPDDFSGEHILKEFNIKPNRTFGLTAAVDLEFIGDDGASLGGVGYNVGIHFNNYTGIGMDQGITGHLPFSAGAGVGGSASLGITSSSDNGLSLQPSLSFSRQIAGGDENSVSLGVSVGASFNSRGGLQQLTIGASVSAEISINHSYTDENGQDQSFTEKSNQSLGGSATYNFGMPTYTPQLSMPFSNLFVSASFKMGGEVFGMYVNGEVGGSFSQQKLMYHSTSQPAYGYLHADEGVKYDNAIMDFNREKDVPFSPASVALPLTNFTYDILSVTGQGISGSYRPYRSDFGQVFDPAMSNPSFSGSLGVEIGLGELLKVGVDISLSTVTSQSGKWKNDDGSNSPYNDLYYTQNSPDPTYEKYYYKEANEKSIDADTTFLQRADGLKPTRYTLKQYSQFDNRLTSTLESTNPGPSGTRLAREKRNESISTLTKGEMSKYALYVPPNLYTAAPAYHTAEITSTTTDGKRYVYGIAAYNTRQEETTFAVGTDEFDGNGSLLNSYNSNTGLIDYYHNTDNSLNGSHGVDNFYSNTILPPYAHSYLLTSVLSTDYVDIDTVPGPSPNDLGTYTKFNYTKAYSNYKWRTPYDSAYYNEGLKWTSQDDKGNYIYGEKEIWYLQSIESKNYIAIFTVANDREDGCEAADKNGGAGSRHMQRLSKIDLYTRANYNAHQANSSIALIPIKEVHFDYNYSLCRGISNNTSGNGKLTLTEISFSYQSSKKGRLSPYKFSYSTFNPPYNIKAYDRWGYYKAQDNAVTGSTGDYPNHAGLSNSEFPYTVQDPTVQDQNATAWTLTKINLPSGGAINVNYESDDYAYVQNQPAAQMFKVIGLSDGSTGIDTSSSVKSLPGTNNNKFFIIRLTTPISSVQDFYNQYLDGLDTYVYFRFLYNMKGPTYEYVPGYSQIQSYGVYPGNKYAYIQFADVTMNDNSGYTINPVLKAALQYGRLNEPKNVWSQPGVNVNGSIGIQLLQAILGSNFVANIADAIAGPNRALYTLHQCAQDFWPNKSWIRLNNPNKHKKGGGSRVKQITVSDEWNKMTSGAMSSFSYGQTYSYTNEDGTSSGVASYEPQLGGDENSLRTPVFYDITHLLAPDDKNYMETPFGESFFPSPSVGYGRVTVQNIKYTGVSKHATGSTVHEFYTAKDYPTITDRTDLDARREKTDPLSLSSFLHIDTKDYMTATQGFYVETNDMHGKPKSQKVYQENITNPISSIEYYYKNTPYLNGSYKLDNTALVVDQTGTQSKQNIGVFFDYVGDFRQQSTQSISGSGNINLDGMLFGPVFVSLPTVWPSITRDETQFRSASVTKVALRSGLLEKVVAKDLGSTVETDNLAYDSETGDVILTKSITDYNDPIYTLNYPAYWYYDGMGPAYKNIGITMSNVTFASGLAAITNGNTFFVPGDVIEMNCSAHPANTTKAWVLKTATAGIKVELANGLPPTDDTYTIKVIQSGRKNMQQKKMATITSLKNPLNGLNSNVYQQVVTASGIEYNDQWSLFCDCPIDYEGADPSASYATGGKGNWRQKRAFAYLTPRTLNIHDNNTNIRKDGVFASYNPLYRKAGSKWQFDTTNWTFTTKVTMFNPNGQEIENQDALGRYSAATYGYNQTMATAVSANAQYREIAFDNVEDYDLKNCGDKHFKFPYPTIDTAQSHTGRRSIRVSASAPLEVTKILSTSNCVTQNPCEIDFSLELCGGGDTHDTVLIDTLYMHHITVNVDSLLAFSGCYNFTGAGAVSPLTISWVTTLGNPTVQVIAGGLQYTCPNGNCGGIITVIGATGCSQKFVVKTKKK